MRDENVDRSYICLSEMDMDPAELAHRIGQRMEHPVIKYVLELPYESAFYNPDDISICDIKNPITWIPPGQDKERPKLHSCGPIRVKGGTGDGGLVYTACSSEKEHYVKGKCNHCWSRRCPVCLNDTCLKMGARIEERFTLFRLLKEKQGEDPGPLGHWVVSPEQEVIKREIQTHKGFTTLRKGIQNDLTDIGCKGGMLFLHPWTQKEDHWIFSPHFHCILHGFLDTDMFLQDHPGWIIKKIHSGQEMESIRLTAAYIASHEGIGIVERDVDEIDYDTKLYGMLLPGFQDGDYRANNGETGPYGAATGKAFRFTDDDYADKVLGKGKMVGDLSWIDWFNFTVSPLSFTIGNNYFGELSNRNIKTFYTERYRVSRTCTVCGEPLNIYSGMCDSCGVEASHMFDNTLYGFSRHTVAIKPAVSTISKDLKQIGMKWGDISPKVSLVVSMKEAMDNLATARPQKVT